MTTHAEDTAKNRAPHIIVIGGTSGVGLALAVHHLQLGWQVSVVGRRMAKIEHINSQYPTIQTYTCELTDDTQIKNLLERLSSIRFDRLIYSAGSYTNERTHQLNQADSDKMLAINLQAFEQVFSWASTQLKQQSQSLDVIKNNITSSNATHNGATNNLKPSLICLASIAGTLDYPYASLYAKSKRAMIATASVYRLALDPYEIQVTCIASGYIDTQALRDLNDGDASHKPFIMSTQTAVTNIMKAIDDDVELAVFPKSMRYITRTLNHLPKPLLNWILRNKLDKAR
ncbi:MULTISPECIES: SDR family NAD(P)-dependent oxidoreductase [unclassified Psychrobacter]|uniref:SDR family NAD(P)-dependent oxidoreductase n=1 Tax=unclassified Psychrobacter TaxID=196806 RepID=UPI003FB88F59